MIYPSKQYSGYLNNWNTPKGPYNTSADTLKVYNLTYADAGNYSLKLVNGTCTGTPAIIAVKVSDPIISCSPTANTLSVKGVGTDRPITMTATHDDKSSTGYYRVVATTDIAEMEMIFSSKAIFDQGGRYNCCASLNTTGDFDCIINMLGNTLFTFSSITTKDSYVYVVNSGGKKVITVCNVTIEDQNGLKTTIQANFKL